MGTAPTHLKDWKVVGILLALEVLVIPYKLSWPWLTRVLGFLCVACACLAIATYVRARREFLARREGGIARPWRGLAPMAAAYITAAVRWFRLLSGEAHRLLDPLLAVLSLWVLLEVLWLVRPRRNIFASDRSSTDPNHEASRRG